MTFNLTHLGGAETVTGSCHLLQSAGLNLLIDCGMAQGGDRVEAMDRWPVSPAKIDYLFVTHAHIDHIGRIPDLIAAGFAGEIIVSHGTKALLGPMLTDALDFSDRRAGEKHRLLNSIDENSWGFEYNQPFDMARGIRFRLGRAGHILGSSWIRFDLPEGESIVFSGDLGARHTPILPDPDIPDPCDLLILESTYGDRLHEDRTQRVERLARILNRALADGGKVLIPAFALGRTQELIYEMDRIFSGKTPVPVFIDSPLGLEITGIYSRLSEFWDKEAADRLQQGDHPIDFENLYAVESYPAHLKLLDLKEPAVIIAGSGMCTGGRILDHLKAGIGKAQNDVFFVGYQARGTPGRDILRYGDQPGGYVILEGERYPIKADIHRLTGYSAHADQKDLVDWAEAIQPKKIRLVHGEAPARRVLAEKLKGR
jgi:metallo-beta-lactamase family protein